MNQPIGMSPLDIWNGIINFLKSVAVIWAAYLIIKQIVDAQKAPDRQQDERIGRVEARLDEIEDHLKNDHTEIKDLKEGRRIEMQALQAILGHDISGNNEAELRDARSGLDAYINSHLS